MNSLGEFNFKLLERRLKRTIRKITNAKFDLTEGQFLHRKDFSNIKDMCDKFEPVHFESLFKILSDRLNEKNVRIRFNAFSLCDAFFNIYAAFRRILLDNLKMVLISCYVFPEEDSSSPAFPNDGGAKLRDFATARLNKWHSDFGSSYPQLEFCYILLRNEELEHNVLNMARLHALKREIRDVLPELRTSCEFLTSNLNLLVPTLENFFINQSQRSRDMKSEMDDEGGIVINIPKFGKESIEITETDDNAVILENAREGYKLIKGKHLPKVEEWIEDLGNSDDIGDELRELKRRLRTASMKYEMLKIRKAVSDESDMEEVPSPTAGFTADDLLMQKIREKEENDNSLARPSQDHPDKGDFGGCYGNTPPVCRAVLPSGKLCPRRDARKCPFHGLIVPRNENGVCIDEKDRKREEDKIKRKLFHPLPPYLGKRKRNKK